MSLMRQVFLLVLGAVLASLLGSVAVTAGSMRQLLQTELQVKNDDNAAALALALSQQRGDVALIELLISAQFDTGYYQSVRWRKADGSLAFERHTAGRATTAPGWFVALTPISVRPGLAQVSNGWNAIGAVEVLSHTAYAHDELWRSTVRSALLLAAVGLVAALAAMGVLRRIRRPLDAVVAQAQAVVGGSFTTVPEPRVPELQRLTQAMNAMVLRVKSMFEAQGEQLQMLRRQAHADPLTGISSRTHFLAELQSALTRDDGPPEAGLVLLRLRDLQGLNHRLGRKEVDQVLMMMASAVNAYPDRVEGCLAGRLNGADFALWLPAPGVAAETAQALAEALRVGLPVFGAVGGMVGSNTGIQVALGAVELPRDQPISAWFGEADAVLARAESQPGIAVEASVSPAPDAQRAQGERAWREQIADALAQRRAKLVQFPVLDRAGQIIHLECPLQLQLDPQTRPDEFDVAARWLPLALRSRLTADIDLLAVSMALDAIGRDGLPRCINIAPASLLDGSFVARLRELVFHAPQAARKLCLDVAELAAIQHFDLLYEMGRQLRPLGVKLGLEHAGAGLSKIDRLYQAGLDYVKLDVAVVTGVSADAGRAAFVRGVVVMLRSLALKVYAEGLVDPLDVQALWDCKLDGVTGPWATAAAGQGPAS